MTELISDFRKGHLPAQWAHNHPIEWESDTEILMISQGCVEAACRSSDGVFLAVAVDKYIYIYHTETFELVETLKCHHTVRYVEFEPRPQVGKDSYQLISQNANLEEETPTFIFYWSLAMSGVRINSREIFTTCHEINVSIEQRKGASLALFHGSAFSHDGKTLLIMISKAGVEVVQHCVIAFDLQSWTIKFRIETDRCMIYCVFSPDNKFIATASFSGYLKLYDSTTGALFKCFGPVGGEKWIAAFSPDSKLIAVTAFTGESGSILIWHVYGYSDRIPITLEGFDSAPRAMAWSPSGQLIAAGSQSGTLIVFDTRTWATTYVRKPRPIPITSQDMPFTEVDSVQWLEDGNKLAFQCGGALVVYDLQTNKKWQWSRELAGGLRSIVYLEKNRWIGSVGRDGNMRFWWLSSRPSEELIDSNQRIDGGKHVGSDQLIDNDDLINLDGFNEPEWW